MTIVDGFDCIVNSIMLNMIACVWHRLCCYTVSLVESLIVTIASALQTALFTGLSGINLILKSSGFSQVTSSRVMFTQSSVTVEFSGKLPEDPPLGVGVKSTPAMYTEVQKST